MKTARMNISHSRFILSKLKIFGEIVTTYYLLLITVVRKDAKKTENKETRLFR